ncbi:MAG TPA: cytochrome c peroxidase [Methylomirabilota bacterium]|nr:cytochrome c peroxidase [Methylomirabilota bacterium]
MKLTSAWPGTLQMCLAALLGSAFMSHSADIKHPPQSRPALRHPVSLALRPDANRAFTANERSGTVSMVDLRSRSVVDEFPSGAGTSHVTLLPDGHHLLATSTAAHELVLLASSDTRVWKVAGLKVASHPVSVCVSPDGGRCFVASLWSRRLSVVDLNLNSEPPSLRLEKVIDLPFAPRLTVFLKRERKLLLMDSFGGNMAVVNPERGELERAIQLPAHNIRGLALTPDGRSLWLAHQILRPSATTLREDIHWGILMANVVRVLRIDALLDPAADPLLGSDLFFLGQPGRGAGDPAGLALMPDGTVMVALAGVDEIAWKSPGQVRFNRLRVGNRPTTITADPRSGHSLVVNSFSDSITVVDTLGGTVDAEIPLGPRPEPGPIDLGERLFHDARLSHDGWMSCHSCHTDGHSNHLLADTLGDGSYGAPKRVLSLLGIDGTEPFGWTGVVATLEEQIRKSIATTMRGLPPSDEQVHALTAYVKSLRPPPALAEARDAIGEPVARGRLVFEQLRCNRCHPPPRFTMPKTYAVGLSDEAGNSAFNPPSLIGVSQRDAFFHDGRSTNLREAIDHFVRESGASLDNQAGLDLLAFLEALGISQPD